MESHQASKCLSTDTTEEMGIETKTRQSMRTILVYPLPMENEDVLKTFLPFAHRFRETYLANDPGHQHDLIVVCNGADPNDEVRGVFDKCGARYERYDGAGFDLGSQQTIAQSHRNALQVNFTSRCYFHRPNWLWKLVVAFEAYGDGLYGVSASREGGNLHVCTRAFMYWTETFRNFTTSIVSRDQGVDFEVTKGKSISDWYSSLALARRIVHWDRTVNLDVFDTVPNRFRDGDQSAMLVFDRHSDLYRDGDETEKKRLATLCIKGQ